MNLITERQGSRHVLPAAPEASQHDIDPAQAGRYIASLTFDAYGRISHCSEAMALLAHRDLAQIHGTTIRTVVPELPIQPHTPGLNIGRLTMSYLGRERPLGIDRNGAGTLLIPATIRRASAASGRVFVLECRRDAYRPFMGALTRQ